MPDKPRVRVLRPEEGERPKVRVCNQRAVANREKARSSTMTSYFDYSKANAEYDRVPPGRYTDHRGARCAQAGKFDTVNQVLHPTPYSDPPPPVRATMPATTANLARGRGRVNLFADKRPEEVGEDTSTPPVRCHTSSAVANMRKSQSGSMATVIVHSADHTDPQRPLRGDSKAAENAERSRGSEMASSLQGAARLDQQPRPRCVSAQAMHQRERAAGVMGDALRGNLSGDTPPKPRLGPGAATNARREGNAVSGNLGEYGKHTADPPAAPRVKPEAARNAAKNAGSLTSLQYSYEYKNRGGRDEDPPSRTRPGPAEEFKKSSQGVATKNLFVKYGQLPGDLKPHAKVQPRGRKIARLSSGSQVAGILSPPKPRRVRRRAKSAI